MVVKLKRTEIYDECGFVFEVPPSEGLEDEFLQRVMMRLGQGRFPLATATMEEIQVGGGFLESKRKMHAIVSKSPGAQRAVYVAVRYGVYCRFAVYMTTKVGLFDPGASNIIRTIRAGIKDFDTFARFSAFHEVSQLVLDQVLSDLGLR